MGRKNRNRKTGKKNRGSNKQQNHKPKYQNTGKEFVYIGAKNTVSSDEILNIAREVFGSLYWCASDDD